MAERTLRVGVIGCGKVAQNMHLPALAKSSRCRLEAVCDKSAMVGHAMAERYAIERVYSTIDAILADDRLDAVIVSVGDPLHVEVATRALHAGKHVLVEKPLGNSAAECRSLRDVVDASRLVLQVGVMKRHDPALAFAREAVRATIGPPRSFAAWYRACEDRYVDEASIFLPVIRDPGYERPAYKRDLKAYFLATHGAHLFDTIRYVVGPPSSVRAVLGRNGDTYTWHGLLRIDGGAVGHFDLSVYIEGDWSEGIDVFGQGGSLKVRQPNPFFLLAGDVRVFEADVASWRSPRFDRGDPYLRQLDAFAASVLNGAPVVADVDDGIAALEVIEAVEASVAAGGDEVKVGIG